MKYIHRYKLVKPKSMMGSFIVDTETNKVVETISDTRQQTNRIIHWNKLDSDPTVA